VWAVLRRFQRAPERQTFDKPVAVLKPKVQA
jgi:hypothetical protein